MPYSILLDVDGVLNTFIETTIDILRNTTGQSLDINTITAYNIEDCLPAETARQIYEIWSSEDFWHKLQPPAGAQNAVKSMLQSGIEVYIMSACSPHTMVWKTEWLRKYYPLVPEQNIMFGAAKHKFNCDFIVEDKLDTLLACSPGTYRICVDYPWNSRGAEYDKNHFICRVKNLTGAHEYIKSVIDEEERNY